MLCQKENVAKILQKAQDLFALLPIDKDFKELTPQEIKRLNKILKFNLYIFQFFCKKYFLIVKLLLNIRKGVLREKNLVI